VSSSINSTHIIIAVANVSNSFDTLDIALEAARHHLHRGKEVTVRVQFYGELLISEGTSFNTNINTLIMTSDKGRSLPHLGGSMDSAAAEELNRRVAISMHDKIELYRVKDKVVETLESLDLSESTDWKFDGAQGMHRAEFIVPPPTEEW